MKSVYKSEKGRHLVEGKYRALLDAANDGLFKETDVPTSLGVTHALVAGGADKPALVCLHGSMSNSATWLGVMRDFGASFRVWCLDIPGECGLSEPIRMKTDSATASRWLAEALDALGIASASFLGMSLGSWYALSFASRFPARATAMALVTTPGIAPQRASFLLLAILCAMRGKKGMERLNKAVFRNVPLPIEALEFQTLVAANFNPLMDPIPIFPDADLRALAMPILYVAGAHDALLDTKKTAARLASLAPRSRASIDPDSGHVIIDKFPEILAFLSESAKAALG